LRRVPECLPVRRRFHRQLRGAGPVCRAAPRDGASGIQARVDAIRPRARRARGGVMSARVIDLFHNTYANFADDVLAAVRAEAFGEDIGQTSWVTRDEYDRFSAWLMLSPRSQVLEVASGSGGPAMYLAERTGCSVTGIDVNPHGVATARQRAAQARG